MEVEINKKIISKQTDSDEAQPWNELKSLTYENNEKDEKNKQLNEDLSEYLICNREKGIFYFS